MGWRLRSDFYPPAVVFFERDRCDVVVVSEVSWMCPLCYGSVPFVSLLRMFPTYLCYSWFQYARVVVLFSVTLKCNATSRSLLRLILGSLIARFFRR